MAALTLEQLSAVCDEIAAISRAGLPLDRGLKDASAELPGRAAQLTEELSGRLAAGEPLDALLLSRADVFPPAYRAMIEAGVRSGDLPAAVDAVSRSARTLANLRHNIRVAWIYPCFLLVTAYVLLWVMLQTLPVMWEFFKVIDLPMNQLERSVSWITARSKYWYPALGVLLAIWIIWDWRRLSARSALSNRGWDLRLIGSGWRVGRQLSQKAAFCELLSLLIKHGTDLPRALRLAAEGSDPTGSSHALDTTCAKLEQGYTQAIEESPLPPLIKCILLSGGTKEILAGRLQKLAEHFRREAEARVSWASVRFPVMVALLVGGSLVILFAVAFWLPWLHILQRLLEPTFR